MSRELDLVRRLGLQMPTLGWAALALMHSLLSGLLLVPYVNQYFVLGPFWPFATGLPPFGHMEADHPSGHWPRRRHRHRNASVLTVCGLSPTAQLALLLT